MDEENPHGTASGDQQDGNALGKAGGKGLNHGAKGAGRGAKKLGHGIKNAPKRLHQGEKGAGLGMQAGGKAMRAGGRGVQAGGKGVEAGGKALGAIPYVGKPLGAPLEAGGKGAQEAGKGVNKAGKGVDKAGRKLKNHANKHLHKKMKPASMMKRFLAYSWLHIGLILVVAIVIIIMMAVALFMATSDDDSSCNSGGAGVGTEVSGKNNVAKLYNFLVSKEKFSSAGASGAVGRAMVESGQTVDPKAYNPGGSVVGIFQWGAGGANGDRLDSGGFVKSGDSSTYTLSNELKLTDYELHHAKKMYYNKFKKESDPSTAAEDWTVYYEGAKGQKDADAQSNARKIYSKFKGNSSSDDVGDTADSGDDSDASSSDCGDDSGDDAEDGTGSIKEHPNGQNPVTWKVDQVPDDVKKYIHSPKDAGMSWGSPKGWADAHGAVGECPTFSNSFFDAIWGLNYVYSADGGNGKGAVVGWKSHMPSGTVSKHPHAGAIAASTNSALATPYWGHTFVVEHVFKNGDYLIAEENWINGVSGAESGKSWDWNYAVVSKDENDVQFYMPPKKYHLHWKRK